MVRVVKLEKVPKNAYFLGYGAFDPAWNPNIDPDEAIKKNIESEYSFVNKDVVIGYYVYEISKETGRYLYAKYSLTKNFRPTPGYLKEALGID